MQDSQQSPKHPSRVDFKPGFRLSSYDLIFLSIGAVVAYFAITLNSLPATIAAYVIFTFFLYCNVFRIRRTAELIWAAAFTLTAWVSFYLELSSWSLVFAGSFVLSVILIAIEMRHPSYHGIFWRSVNPRLPVWWEQQHRQPS